MESAIDITSRHILRGLQRNRHEWFARDVAKIEQRAAFFQNKIEAKTPLSDNFSNYIGKKNPLTNLYPIFGKGYDRNVAHSPRVFTFFPFLSFLPSSLPEGSRTSRFWNRLIVKGYRRSCSKVIRNPLRTSLKFTWNPQCFEFKLSHSGTYV